MRRGMSRPLLPPLRSGRAAFKTTSLNCAKFAKFEGGTR